MDKLAPGSSLEKIGNPQSLPDNVVSDSSVSSTSTMAFELSKGSLKQIMEDAEIVDPIMQVWRSKKIKIGQNSATETYRILLSDGRNVTSFAMLAPQISYRVSDGELTNNSIIKIKQYTTPTLIGKDGITIRVLVIFDMEILAPGSGLEKIGNPQNLLDYVDYDSSVMTTNRPISSTSTNGTVSNNNSGDVSLKDQPVSPIYCVSTYLPYGECVLKARVIHKTLKRAWSNGKAGYYFSIDLIDESCEIRVDVFRKLVDEFYDMIEIDKVYYISTWRLISANRQFSNLKTDYEMIFNDDTFVQECHDDVSSIPQIQYNFVPIDKIAQIVKGALVDVLGVCKSTSELHIFQAKGRERKGRKVVLVDQSNASVTLFLWYMDAEKFDGSSQPIIAIRGAKVGEFGGGKIISVISNSIMKINPDVAESHRLRDWYDNAGVLDNINNISAKTTRCSFPWLSFKEVQDQSLGTGEKGDYYQTKGTVLLFGLENCFYKACPTEECNKKVVNIQNGMFRCESCNREYPNFKYRFFGKMNVSDWSGDESVIMFASEAEKILGMTSQQVAEAAENNPQALIEIADRASFKQFIFKLRTVKKSSNGEASVHTVAVNVEPINYEEYNAHLISRIQQLINAT